jgi:pectinesterase
MLRNLKSILLSFTLFSFTLSYAQYDLVVAKDGTGNVTTVQAAFDKVPANNTKTYTIFVKKGTYKQKLKLAKGKNNVFLIGEDVATTILTFDDYSAKVGSTSGSYSTLIEADNFTAQNITFENTIDSRLSQYSSNGQGVALNVTGDKVSFYDCMIKGFQDTFFNSGKGRVYTKCSTIKGTTDFIFGSGVNIFEDCIIVNLKSSATTAASNKNANNTYNYLFLHCELKAETSGLSCTLGRPWGAQARVVFFECIEGAHIKSDGWQNWSSADYSKTAYFAEYNCSGPGYKPNNRISWSHQLNATEASKYTVAKMFAKNANADSYSTDWLPSTPSGACGGQQSSVMSISITSPINNASFNAPANVTISANASITGGTISKVEFFQGTTSLGSDNSAPYSINWSNVPVGNYSITAVATDNSNATKTSSAVTIKVVSADCAGVSGGSASLDACGICTGGTTGKTACKKDCNGDLNGTAVLDNCGVCTGGKSIFKSCKIAIEAEDACKLEGTIDNNNAGFSGLGFANTNNVIGASATWKVNSISAQTATLTITFANGGTTNRNGDLYINGIKSTTVLLAPTGSWSTWNKISVNVSLASGLNVLDLNATPSDGLANLDILHFSEGVSVADCIITGIDGNTNAEFKVFPNPTNNKVQWEVSQEWKLFDSRGLELASGEGQSTDLSTYAPGIYLLNINNVVVKIIRE